MCNLGPSAKSLYETLYSQQSAEQKKLLLNASLKEERVTIPPTLPIPSSHRPVLSQTDSRRADRRTASSVKKQWTDLLKRTGIWFRDRHWCMLVRALASSDRAAGHVHTLSTDHCESRAAPSNFCFSSQAVSIRTCQHSFCAALLTSNATGMSVRRVTPLAAAASVVAAPAK